MRGGIRHLWAAALIVLACLVTGAWAIVPTASAQDGCGGVETSYPSHLHHSQRPPLAIGDSTMLLSLRELANVGYEVNAHGCREWGEALALIRARRSAHTLPHMVVIALGADGAVTPTDVGQTLGLLCCTHLLVLVTNRELGGGSGSDATTERKEVAEHHNRAKLLDWVKYSAGHAGWFQPDGLHLTNSGSLAFTHLLAKALRWAYRKPKPKSKRRRRHGHAQVGGQADARRPEGIAGLMITPSLARASCTGKGGRWRAALRCSSSRKWCAPDRRS